MSILSTLVQYLLFWHKKLPKSYFQEEKALFFTAAWRLMPTNESAGFYTSTILTITYYPPVSRTITYYFLQYFVIFWISNEIRRQPSFSTSFWFSNFPQLFMMFINFWVPLNTSFDYLAISYFLLILLWTLIAGQRSMGPFSFFLQLAAGPFNSWSTGPFPSSCYLGPLVMLICPQDTWNLFLNYLYTTLFVR